MLISEEILSDLGRLVNDGKSPPRVADVARQRVTAIEREIGYLASSEHRIAFVGSIGVGKSSLIAVLSGLLVGGRPADRAALRASSVLAVGSGGTTVCEVRIRSNRLGDPQVYGLVIDPYSIEAMSREIQLFALDEWARRQRGPGPGVSSEDGDPTPREVARVIRNMTGLAERQELVLEEGQRRRRAIDPLDDLVARHASGSSLASELVERAGLRSRTETAWWWGPDEEPLDAMRRCFDEVNHGRTPTAMLPQRISLVVPDPVPGIGGLDLEIIDTRGFDGSLAARPDILRVLRDPRATVVVCTPFREAPGELVKGLLRDLARDATLRSVAERVSLLLLDHGDSDGVNGADGDRVFGQDLKIGECARSLEAAGLDAMVPVGRILAFDALQDRPEELAAVIGAQLTELRRAASERLERQLEDAVLFLEGQRDAGVERARDEMDRRIGEMMVANRPHGLPLGDPLEGLYEAVRVCRFASQVYASARRNGRYGALDAYAAVRAGAARAATVWLAELDKIVRGLFRAFEQDAEFRRVAEHLRLRKAQYVQAYIDRIHEYADAVEREVEHELAAADDQWEGCASEWGRGSGFKTRVNQRLIEWSAAQSLHAHEGRKLGRVLPIAGLLSK